MFEDFTILSLIWWIIFSIFALFMTYLFVRIVSHAIYNSKFDFIKRIKGVRDGNEKERPGT